MPDDNTNGDSSEDVDIEENTVEEAEIEDVDEDVSVEEELKVEEEGDDVSVTEDVSVEEAGEEKMSVEEEIDVDEGKTRPGLRKSRERIGEEADRAVDQFDQRLIDMLSWVLDTETRARIYVYLRQHPASTSEEVAQGTGLYPSTVREALAELHDEERVTRGKRESEGAGNNPYEYTAIAPSDLVGGIVGQIQDELNTVFNLDKHLGSGDESESEPVRISVEEEVDEMNEDDEDENQT